MAEFMQYEDVDRLPVDNLIIRHIKNKNANKFEAFDDLDLICFDLLDIFDMSKETEKITVCQTAEQVYYICESLETSDKLKTFYQATRINKTTPATPDTVPAKELYGFFAFLLKDDIDKMDDLEERITDMEDVLLKDNKTDYTVGIISFRKELLRLKRYYEQLSQVFDGIIENENHFIDEKNIKYFKFLDQRADRLLSHIVNLRDYITQVREAYQAQIDIEQNRLMKIFTVITAIFLPLTLIVGWYGMNMKIPEYGWKYGYLYVIVFSVVVVVLMIVYFKKKKWF
ncbi:MAG: magnesium transporter [Oscillospiraceae bacterium]|nr:magnesium transporter [Oscillospiraceae bacterium]